MYAPILAVLLAVAPATGGPAAPFVTTAQATPMTEARFWQIIEQSAAGNRDPQRQAETLRKLLAALPTADVEAFQAAYDRKKSDSYSWDLWGATFVIHGGASDDGFDYFRDWLISRGRTTFEAAMADPDRLADLIPAGTNEPLEFESFAYMPGEVWTARTGKKLEEMPVGATLSEEPTGKPWTEDPAVLAKRYPKLRARFGSAPLE